MPHLDETTATPILAEYMRAAGYPWSIWTTNASGKYRFRGTAALNRAHIWWLLRQPTGGTVRSYPYIAHLTNGAAHTTVMYAIARYERQVRERAVSVTGLTT